MITQHPIDQGGSPHNIPQGRRPSGHDSGQMVPSPCRDGQAIRSKERQPVPLNGPIGIEPQKLPPLRIASNRVIELLQY
jgi:hypothetical protein